MPYEAFKTDLNTLYNGCCTAVVASTTAGDNTHLMDLAEAMATDIYNLGDMPNEVPEALLEAYAHEFIKAVNMGFVATEGAAAQNEAMVAAIKHQVYQFSAAKSYTQMKQLTQALLDENDKLRTRSQYRQAAYQINDTHVNAWLNAEMDNCVCASEMAGKWVGIEANKDVFDLLEFDAILDSHTTQTCRSLNGTKLPPDDPFWDVYYLPNHYGERSTIKQLRHGTPTPADEVPSADIPVIFRTNLAKHRMVFPPGHPYFKEAPAEVIHQGNEAWLKATGK